MHNSHHSVRQSVEKPWTLLGSKGLPPLRTLKAFPPAAVHFWRGNSPTAEDAAPERRLDLHCGCHAPLEKLPGCVPSPAGLQAGGGCLTLNPPQLSPVCRSLERSTPRSLQLCGCSMLLS